MSPCRVTLSGAAPPLQADQTPALAQQVVEVRQRAQALLLGAKVQVADLEVLLAVRPRASSIQSDAGGYLNCVSPAGDQATLLK